jgi:hypothetical protein
MRAAALILFAALAAGPAIAVTSIPANAPEQRPGVIHGVVELHSSTQLKVDGKAYLLGYGALPLFDRNGKALEGVRLPAGTRIAFSVRQDGAFARVTSVWIL